MGKKSKGGFYAVRRGRTPGVYLTWAECEEQVKGVSNDYKRFDTEDEALSYAFMPAASAGAAAASGGAVAVYDAGAAAAHAAGAAMDDEDAGAAADEDSQATQQGDGVDPGACLLYTSPSPRD